MKERGYGRMALGFVLLLGVAGSADQTPLNWHMLPMTGVSLLIALWGGARAKHGPTLRLLPGLLARLPKVGSLPAARRHALIVQRAQR